ncbi:MAG: MBOAT family protein, partial [Phycisphaerales bacterium]|nr:MBOAT family protein [Phycisphaerales bacterium]
MLFNSLVFPVFFVLFLCLYWPLRRHLRLQNLLTLVGSYVFYGWWDTRFLALIVVSTAIDYGAGRVIEVGRLSGRERLLLTIFVLGTCIGVLLPWGALLDGQGLSSEAVSPLAVIGAGVLVYHAIYGVITRLSEDRRRRWALTVSVVSNLGLLAVFKYLDFFIGSFADLWHGLTGAQADVRLLHIILPVGISFYTFQTMSYTIDVYRRKIPSTDDGVAFAAYVAFFPQLVAGPIERASHLLGQFSVEKKIPTMDDIGSAMWLIAWGFYKKLVIADNLAKSVNGVFGPYDQAGIAMDGRSDGLTMLFAVYAFAFQIYCDFSGYTDIARGTARLLGFDIMRNFNLPYF